MMFLNKLRLLNAVYSRSNVINETIRQTKIQFPAITQTLRTYARYIDDDDDDMPVTRTRAPSREQKTPSFSGRASFNNRQQSFGDRPPSFRRSNQFYGGFQSNRPQTNRSSFNQDIQKLEPIQYDMEDLSELKKDFYKPSPITQNRTDDEIIEFRKKHEISVPGDAPKPIFTFAELENLPPQLGKQIQKQNFVDCTPIQAQGMPIALSGKNMVGIAQTG